jgi:hypothetical protein
MDRVEDKDYGGKVMDRVDDRFDRFDFDRCDRFDRCDNRIGFAGRFAGFVDVFDMDRGCGFDC